MLHCAGWNAKEAKGWGNDLPFGENTAVQIFHFCRSFTKFSLDSAWSLLHVFLMLGKEAGADDMLLLSNNPFMFFYLFL